MKILVNATTVVGGGGIQVAISFIEQTLNEHRFHWKFLLSKQIFDNLRPELLNHDKMICVYPSPARLLNGHKSRSVISKLCNDWQPDLVYSLGFPSYIRFRQIEIGRYTNPWEINTGPLPWSLYPNWVDRLRIYFGILYRQFWAKRADFLETQTIHAKMGIQKRLHYPLERIKVVPNSPNQIFVSTGSRLMVQKRLQASIKIFCLSAPHPHKNLDLIPQVIFELKNRFKLEPVFYLTLPEFSPLMTKIHEKAITLGVDGQIRNLGVLKLAKCIDYYEEAFIVFLPTLLEIFSATYLEAMAMKVPIVTTDLEFARDNCGDAALFFEPGNPVAAAACIYKLIVDPELYQKMVSLGNIQLSKYPSNDEKYYSLFNWFEFIIKESKE